MIPLYNAGDGTMGRKYELSQSLDRYLQVILRMEERHAAARVKDIAKELGFKKRSVISTLKKLNELGLIVYPPYRPIHLTKEGRCVAEYIGWRNGVLVSFLMTVLHIASNEAEDAARRIGYALEEKVIDRMRRFMEETYTEIVYPADFW